MRMEEIIHNIMGGSVTTRPAGKFIDQDGREVEYEDAIIVTMGRRSQTIGVPQALALVDAVKNNKKFAEAIGAKTGILG